MPVINPDTFNTINESFYELGNAWLWADSDIYSVNYVEVLFQPINLGNIGLEYLRFKVPEVNLYVRSGYTSASPLLYFCHTFTINEFSDTNVSNHNDLNKIQGGSTTERYHLSASTYNYLQSVSANVQDQINTTNFNLRTSSTSLQIQINTLAQQSISGMGAGTINRVGKFVNSGSLGDSSINDDGSLVKIYNPLSASGNISANSFVKIGGTSAQFLKANGSVDSNTYTTTQTVSSISGSLQNQLNNNNNILSAYLPLSGGVLTGNLSATQTIKIIKALGASISGASRIELLNNDSTYGQSFWSDSGSNLRLAFLHGDSTWTDKFKFLNTGALSAVGNITATGFIKIGGTSTQFLKADGSIDSNVYTTTATTSSVSATLQSQITNNNNRLSAYLPLSGGTLTGQLLVKSNVSASGDIIGSRHIIPGGLASQFLKADGSVDSNSYALDTLGSYYLPLSGGTLNGSMATQNVRPVAPFSFDLGSVFFPYSSLYVSAINANKINMEGSIIPINSISYDLGSDAYKWKKIYTKDFTSVAMSTTFDRNVEAVDVKSHILLGFNNQLAPHLNFSSSLGTSANLSGDFYFDGNYLKIRDKNLVLNTLAYTSNLSAYTPTSGFDRTISAYLPLSGGTLSGQLKGTTISASGNISANAYVKNGGTSTQFLKADGSVDSNVYITSSSLTPYTLTTTTSAISANLQSQITNNNNKLSAYLPLSGGTLAGDIVTQNIRPTAPFFNDLGTVFFPYASLYVSAINANKINMEGSIIPINSISYDLGSNSNRWSTIYTRDLKSVAVNTVIDRAVEAIDVKSHILIGFNNQLAPHLNFSTSLGTSANLSGDFYFDGTSLKIRDKNSVLKTLSYTSDLSAYTPTSGSITITSAYLPLSGGVLTGNLSATQTIKIIKALGASISGASRIELLNNDSTYGQSFWSDSGSNLRLAFLHGDSTWTDKFRFFNTGALSAVGNITANGFIKNGGTSTQFLKADGSSDSNVYITSALNSYLGFNNGGNNVTRGISGDIGSSESWELAGKASTTAAGDVRINLYTSSVTQMVPFYITQYSGVTQQNSVTLMDASGKSGFNDISTNKITNNVIGGVGFEQSNSKISDTTISADNLSVGSSLIVQNTARTADKIKVFDNLVQMRSGSGDPFVQLSASFIGVSGTILNVSTANPSYPAILRSEIGLFTSGCGFNGKTTYLKSIPTVNSADSLMDRVAALQTILANYGLINLI